MSNLQDPKCPECSSAIDRRDVLRYLAIAPTALTLSSAVGSAKAANNAELLPMPRLWKPGPAEALVKELYSGMTEEQKKSVCLPYDDTRRLSVNPNHALSREIGSVFNPNQIELIERIVKAMSAGDETSWKQITRGGTWDASKTFTKTGANIFGDPLNGKYAFLFTGHHITLRCDGEPKDGVAFGGPIYYGHTPNPYSDRNVFFYQTQQAMNFYNALNKDQRESATISKGTPGEGAGSIKLPGKPQGVAFKDLMQDQKDLMQKVMRSLLSPFRKEDADEVMEVIKLTGGLDKLQFAFYSDSWEGTKTSEQRKWSFWRIEGPGFVWNFRVLPHVHTYVNVKNTAS